MKNEILAEQSSRDPLTGLKNHRALYERLMLTLNNKKANEEVSIAMMDIDDFKRVNDIKGHIYGDKILVGVSETLTKYARSTDIVGRYGGEEFLIIFPNTSKDQAYALCDLMLKETNEKFVTLEPKTTMSCGIQNFSGQSLNELIQQADVNLYKAKSSGKNRIVI